MKKYLLVGLASVAVFALVFATLSYVALPFLQSELRVDMSLSDPGGSFEVYANKDYGNPHRIAVTQAGRKSYVFSRLPIDLWSVRLNTADKRDIGVTYHAVEIFIDNERIFSFPTDTFDTHLVKNLSGEGEYVSIGNDPTFITGLPSDIKDKLNKIKRNMKLQISLFASLIVIALSIVYLYGTKFLRLQREGRNYGFERKYQITGSFSVKYFEYILPFVHRLRFVFFPCIRHSSLFFLNSIDKCLPRLFSVCSVI